jgi:hypothetical protein
MLEILTPIWIAKQETAKRVRGRIESILAATFVTHSLPTGNNPARQKSSGTRPAEKSNRSEASRINGPYWPVWVYG